MANGLLPSTILPSPEMLNGSTSQRQQESQTLVASFTTTLPPGDYCCDNGEGRTCGRSKSVTGKYL